MTGAWWWHVHEVGANCLNIGCILTALGQKCTECTLAPYNHVPIDFNLLQNYYH